MYEYRNHILSIPARLLYEDWQALKYQTYLTYCRRGKLIRTQHGRGKGNEAYVSFPDLPDHLRAMAIEKLGDPDDPKVRDQIFRNDLIPYIQSDPEVTAFFRDHRTPKDEPLPKMEQVRRATNVLIFQAIERAIMDMNPNVLGSGSRVAWEEISKVVNKLPADKYTYKLPKNYRSLQRKFKQWLHHGCAAFIHKGEGHVNSTKIKDEVSDYLIAQYALPIKLTIPEVLSRYNRDRIHQEGWPELTNSALYTYLHQPDIQRIWMAPRHGKETYNRINKHAFATNKADLFPNAYWGIDGTKLDWVHLWEGSSNKMGAKLKIDVVIDIYSECIIGSTLSFTESHLEHFKAIKGAVKMAGCRPYFISYDHQGGHKMQRMQELYDSLVATDGGTHYAHAPRSHSNPVEQIFNRFQQQVISKFWFSDGQSVTVKRDDNKMNAEFVQAHRDQLKSIEELQDAWEAAVNLWNNAPHPRYDQTRLEVNAHLMPRREPLTLFDIMDKMWIAQKKKPIKYWRHGLDLYLGGQKYQYEVYDADGQIDMEFRRKYLGKKFIVRYDPEFLDGYIQLCDTNARGEIIHIANAEPKRTFNVVPALMREGEKEQWARDYQVRELEYERDQQAYEEIVQRTGISAQQEIDDQDLLIKMKGDLTKVQRSRIESEENLSALAQL